MNIEFKALMINSTWVIVPLTHEMNVISNKWVFMTKLKSYGTLDKPKARLVVRGFQQNVGIDYFDTFNLVVKHSTIRILFSIATTFGWSNKLMLTMPFLMACYQRLCSCLNQQDLKVP